MDRARKQLLASARFTAQKNGQITSSNLLDFFDNLANRSALANDPVNPLLLMFAVFLEFLFQAVALRHKALAITRHQCLQSNGLAHKIGHHGQESYIFVKRVRGGVAIDPLNHDGSECAIVSFNRNTDKRPLRGRTVRVQLAPIGKERTLGDVAHNQWHTGNNNLANSLFRKPLKVLPRGCLAPSSANNR